MTLIEEVAAAVDVPLNDDTNFHCTIWEDNIGALTLSHLELPRMTPRSKHIGIKYHWFREHVASKKFRVVKVDTKEQIADIFTKGLGPTLFRSLRKMLCGW